MFGLLIRVSQMEETGLAASPSSTTSNVTSQSIVSGPFFTYRDAAAYCGYQHPDSFIPSRGCCVKRTSPFLPAVRAAIATPVPFWMTSCPIPTPFAPLALRGLVVLRRNLFP